MIITCIEDLQRLARRRVPWIFHDYVESGSRLASKCGANAIAVSNHGGRQLDGAPSSIAALPAIADAVGDRIEFQMDGGIRSGQDVARARALGARGVHIGRALLYGLGAAGEAGVRQCLDLIRRELDVTMALCSVTDVRDIDRAMLWPVGIPAAR